MLTDFRWVVADSSLWLPSTVRHAFLYLDGVLESPLERQRRPAYGFSLPFKNPIILAPLYLYSPLNEIELLQSLGEPSN